MRNHTNVPSAHSPLVSDLLHVSNPSRGWEICGYFAVRAWEGTEPWLRPNVNEKRSISCSSGVPNVTLMDLAKIREATACK
jgi:hypothetical protein